jgi:predicted RNase H-like nuclease (RuvC/YqgF family)
MTNRDARDRAFSERMKSAERKWEFRYNNQNKRIKELQETISKLRAKIKELKSESS